MGCADIKINYSPLYSSSGIHQKLVKGGNQVMGSGTASPYWADDLEENWSVHLPWMRSAFLSPASLWYFVFEFDIEIGLTTSRWSNLWDPGKFNVFIVTHSGWQKNPLKNKGIQQAKTTKKGRQNTQEHPRKQQGKQTQASQANQNFTNNWPKGSILQPVFANLETH